MKLASPLWEACGSKGQRNTHRTNISQSDKGQLHKDIMPDLSGMICRHPKSAPCKLRMKVPRVSCDAEFKDMHQHAHWFSIMGKDLAGEVFVLQAPVLHVLGCGPMRPVMPIHQAEGSTYS